MKNENRRNPTRQLAQPLFVRLLKPAMTGKKSTE
jgi:hypothetical protein